VAWHSDLFGKRERRFLFADELPQIGVAAEPVVVAESPLSREKMQSVFRDLDTVPRRCSKVEDYTQEV
jgi:hypothetical protein